MTVKELPDIEYLRKCLDYDPETGIFRWKYRPDMRQQVNTLFEGKIAGRIHHTGYRVITLNSRKYLAHRLAWLFCHGDLPEGLEMDHINGDRADNRIANLRFVTTSQNQMNRKSENNLPLGVCFSKSAGKYQAQITINGKYKYLGLFTCPIEAGEAYKRAANELFGEYAAHNSRPKKLGGKFPHNSPSLETT